MAVYRKLVCKREGCKKSKNVPSEPNKIPTCVCGGAMKYLPGWNVKVNFGRDGAGKKIPPYYKYGFETKTLAKAHEGEIYTQRANGAIKAPPSKKTIQDGIQLMEDHCRSRIAQKKMAEGTATDYAHRYANFAAFFPGNYQLIKLDHADIERYVTHRLEQKAKPSSINAEIAAVRALLNALVKKKILSHNPIANHEEMPVTWRDRYLNEEEKTTLLSACLEISLQLYTMVMLALNTGLRRNNVFHLKWSDIDFKKGVIGPVVVKHKRRGVTSSPKTVIVPVHQKVIEELRFWRSQQLADLQAVRKHGKESNGAIKLPIYVFPSPVIPGKPISLNSDWGFPKALEKAKIVDFVWHDLRHTFATLFLRKYPHRIEWLANIMGHSGSYMTRRYAHMLPQDVEELMRDFFVGLPEKTDKSSVKDDGGDDDPSPSV